MFDPLAVVVLDWAVQIRRKLLSLDVIVKLFNRVAHDHLRVRNGGQKRSRVKNEDDMARITTKRLSLRK